MSIELPGVDDLADSRCFGIDRERGCGHLHGLVNTADLEREIHARRLADVKVDARARGACEPRLLRIDFVTAGLKQRTGIEAARVGLQIRNYPRGNIGNAYRYARDRGIDGSVTAPWTEAVC